MAGKHKCNNVFRSCSTVHLWSCNCTIWTTFVHPSANGCAYAATDWLTVPPFFLSFCLSFFCYFIRRRIAGFIFVSLYFVGSVFVGLFVSFFVFVDWAASRLLIGLPVVCLFDSSVGHSFLSLLLLFIYHFVVCLFGCLVTQLVF